MRVKRSLDRRQSWYAKQRPFRGADHSRHVSDDLLCDVTGGFRVDRGVRHGVQGDVCHGIGHGSGGIIHQATYNCTYTTEITKPDRNLNYRSTTGTSKTWHQ